MNKLLLFIALFPIVLMGCGSAAAEKVVTKTETVTVGDAGSSTQAFTRTAVPTTPAAAPAVDPATYKAQCPNIEFRALNKNPASYTGQKYKVQGQVIQILESDHTEIRLNVTPDQYGYWSDTIYVYYAGKTEALDKSIINVYGEVAGPYSYQSQAGWAITLPLINAKYIEVVQT